MRGEHKSKDGKITQVYRKKFVVHVERVSRDKVNGEYRCRFSVAAF